MKYIFALVALIQVTSSIKIGQNATLVEIKSNLALLKNETQSLAKVNITANVTANETIKKIVGEAEKLRTLVQNGQQSGVKYTDEELKGIVGLYDGLYGMWSPYYHPVKPEGYNPDTPPFLYHYPYYNPWTPAYVDSINAMRDRLAAESMMDHYQAVDGAVNHIVGKIYENHSKAVADAAEMSDAAAKKAEAAAAAAPAKA